MSCIYNSQLDRWDFLFRFFADDYSILVFCVYFILELRIENICNVQSWVWSSKQINGILTIAVYFEFCRAEMSFCGL